MLGLSEASLVLGMQLELLQDPWPRGQLTPEQSTADISVVSHIGSRVLQRGILFISNSSLDVESKSSPVCVSQSSTPGPRVDAVSLKCRREFGISEGWGLLGRTWALKGK